MTKASNAFLMILIIIVVVAFDQYTKWLVVQKLNQQEYITVVPNFFNIVLTYNKGAAFGLFSGVHNDLIRHLLLGISTMLALGTVIYLLGREYLSDMIARSALGMILGGAIGNIIDRIVHGAVVDFLDVYYKDYHWPAFNVADSAIFVGVVILLLHSPRPNRVD